MDLDKNNFYQLQAMISLDIQQCDFIALDCEFSGLLTQYEQKQNIFDSYEEIYQKGKHTCINFHLLQLGFTTFRWCEDKKKYVSRTYNAYLNKTYDTGQENITITLNQQESMNFLSKNGMDFKKIYNEGLTYQRIKNQEIQKSEKRFGYFLSSENQIYFEKLIEIIQIFLENQQNQNEMELNCQSKYMASKFLNGYLLKKYLGDKHSRIQIEKHNTEEEIVIIRKVKPKEISINMEQEVNENQLGFTLIIQQIIESKRPIIGHHFSLDLMFIYNTFIAELPETYLEFLNEINQIFPYVFDTKVLAIKSKQKNKKIVHYLEGLYQSILHDKKVLQPFNNCIQDTDSMFQKYNLATIYHEAGFDSFITGSSFIALQYFNQFENEKEKLKQKNELDEKDKNNSKKNSQKCKNVNELQLYESLLKYIMSKQFDQQFAFENNLYLHCQSGGILDLSYERLKNKEGDLYNRSQYKSNTLTLFNQNNCIINIKDISQFFSQFGDCEILSAANDLIYIKYDTFVQQNINIETIRDLMNQTNQINQCTTYLERKKRFKAFYLN